MQKVIIGIKPVHGIDDVIAKYVFDNFVEKNGYVYVPDVVLTQTDSYNFHALILLC